MTSWATCGTGKPREVTTSKKEPEEKKANPHVDRYERLNLPRDVREEIGRKTKNLIDMGRCDFVSKRKMPNAKLAYYTESCYTLENVLLKCIIP